MIRETERERVSEGEGGREKKLWICEQLVKGAQSSDKRGKKNNKKKPHMRSSKSCPRDRNVEKKKRCKWREKEEIMEMERKRRDKGT